MKTITPFDSDIARIAEWEAIHDAGQLPHFNFTLASLFLQGANLGHMNTKHQVVVVVVVVVVAVAVAVVVVVVVAKCTKLAIHFQ